jgi:hypothetical protein
MDKHLTTKKNAVFWGVTPCDSCKNRQFGGTFQKTTFFTVTTVETSNLTCQEDCQRVRPLNGVTEYYQLLRFCDEK